MPTTAPANGEGEPTAEAILEEAKVFTDGNASRDRRLQAAATLCKEITDFGRLPTRAEKPKLPTFLKLIQLCRPLYDPSQTDLEASTAKVLGCVYRQTHAIYKPDDNAAARTVRMYREKHRAAAEASQAIVIYPTNHLTAR
jgi:hypothetical protein